MSHLRLNSFIYYTADLPTIRRFYADTLGLEVGTYEHDGKIVPDESPTYVNFNLGGTLLGFEAAKAAETGSIVFEVESVEQAVAGLAQMGIQPEKRTDKFAIIRDPEGREIILQA